MTGSASHPVIRWMTDVTRRISRVAYAATLAVAIHGCEDRSVPTAVAVAAARGGLPRADAEGRHIVVFTGERVPPDFEARVAELGGVVEAELDGIGVAVVTGLSMASAGILAAGSDVRAVEPDVLITNAVRNAVAVDASSADALAESPAAADALSSPAAAALYARQWNLRAVHAPEAWTAGHTGSRDVVVAILDSGIDYLHPDLAGLVDLDRSKSFVPEDEAIIAARFPGRLPFSDLNNHGTSVASIVASNATVLAGINREVTFLAVKIWDRTAEGSVGRMLAGIIYAADQGVDVINISGSSTFAMSDNPGIVAAVNRATNYAFRKGTLIVSVAMNDASDLDHNGDALRLPCESPHVICVSATAPTAAAGTNGPWMDVDATAPYTAFGRSAVDVAAPGGFGDFANPNPQIGQFRRIWAPCTTTVTETSAPACVRGMTVAQPFGTSFAAPHVTGLAALLVAQLGHRNPALIRSRILESADDRGAPGVDPVYGHGRINIARALGVLP